MANIVKLNDDLIIRQPVTFDTTNGTMYPFTIYMSRDLSDTAMRTVLLAAEIFALSLSEDTDGNCERQAEQNNGCVESKSDR